MYLQIDPKTFQVAELDSRAEKSPAYQYYNGVEKDLILASVSGRNTLNSKRFFEDIKIEIFDLKTLQQFRGLCVVVKTTSNEVGKISIGYAAIKSSRTKSGTTQDHSSLPPDLIFLERILHRGPDDFARLVCAVEEFYAGNQKINHNPWLAGYLEQKSKGMEFTTWGEFGKKTGLLLP